MEGEEDRVKELLKDIFSTIERKWGPEVIRDAYQEFEYQKEFDEEMKRRSIDDF